MRLILIRTGDPDFSDREVTLLAVLRPHLQPRWTPVELARQGGRGLTPRLQVVARMVAAAALPDPGSLGAVSRRAG